MAASALSCRLNPGVPDRRLSGHLPPGEDDLKPLEMPRPLTSDEYEQMMREFEEAEEWMDDQLKAQQVAATSERSVRSEKLPGRQLSSQDKQDFAESSEQ